MKINGYKLRSAIKRWDLRRATAVQMFDEKKYYFPNDVRPDLMAISREMDSAERNVCLLQEAQGRYNLVVTVDVVGEEMTLAQAVKRLGGAGRAEKMWRMLLGGMEKKARWERTEGPPVRKEDEERAVRSLPDDEIKRHVERAALFAAALRESIAIANATDVELELDEALLS